MAAPMQPNASTASADEILDYAEKRALEAGDDDSRIRLSRQLGIVEAWVITLVAERNALRKSIDQIIERGIA